MTVEMRDNCPGCGAGVGQLHDAGCEVEPCPYCGRQVVSCSCPASSRDVMPMDDRLPWDGYWPGAKECVAFGWFVRRVPPPPGSKAVIAWVRCGPDEPGASPDLNRLRAGDEARWSRCRKRWVLRRKT